MDLNRFIKTYERMNGKFSDYVQIKEVEELPNPSYKATIYMNNKVGKETQDLFASMGIEVDYTKPIDYVEFVKSYFTAIGIQATSNSNVYKTLKEGVNKFVPSDKTYYFDLICDINKIYGNILHKDKYEDITEAAAAEFGVVYIGNDINEVGKHDQTFESLIDNNKTITGGLYIVWEEREGVSTDTIYKKEILEEGTPINTNYVFGENLGMMNGQSWAKSCQEVFNKHRSENPKWQDEEDLGLAITLGYSVLFLCHDYTNDDTNSFLKYIDNKYQFRNKFNDDSEFTTKTFDTIEEVSNFILNDESFTQIGGSTNISGMRDYWKEYDLTPIYSDKLDESLDLTKIPYYVVMGPSEEKVHTGTYKYYIFNGSEYIEIGGNNSGDASNYIIKETEGTSPEELNKVTFTKEEIEELKKGKDLILTSNLNEETPAIIFARNNSYVLLDKNNNIGVITFSVNVNMLLGYFKGSLLLGINGETAALVRTLEEKMVSFQTNVNIEVSDWAENINDTDYLQLGYKYMATKRPSDLSIDTSSLVNITFRIENALSGNFAPCCESGDSGVSIFAKEKPTDNVIINVEVIY